MSDRFSRGLRQKSRQLSRSPRRWSHLLVEALEDRCVPSVSPSLFESNDGNLVPGANPGATDWSTVANLQIGVDLPTGQSDNSLGQGAKEDSPVPSVVTGSIPNNKSDLTRFYVANEAVGNQVFLYLSWQRANTLGTANIDFEFNQSETVSANGVTPVRTAGDILITFDFASGGNVVNLGLRTWTGSAWSGAIDLDAAGYADGAVNNGFTVVDPITGATLADKTFGEAAINLTAAGVFPANECVHFGRAYVKSRSSDSFTAEMKDFIAPIAVNIENCPDVSITKVADNGTISAGDQAGFTISVTNHGPIDAANVSFDDDLPDGVNWTIQSQSGGFSIVNGVLSFDAATMTVGQTSTVHIVGMTDAADCGILTNTVTVSATNEHEEHLSNNTATAQIVVECPDVAVVKTADADTINAGDQAGFTITVTNTGAGNAYDVSFDDTLPGGVSWSIESQSGGFSLAAGVLSFDAAALATGESRTVHVVGMTDAEDCGVLTNTVTVTARNEEADHQGDNTSSASITVECPDVTVLKVADDAVVSAGDGVGFTITVTNNGEGTAYGVTLSDTLPSGFSWQIDSGPGSIVNGVLSANLGNLATGASVSIHVSAVSDAADAGLHSNTAIVAATNEASEHTGNNTSTDSFTVLTPDLHVTKTIGDTGLNTGSIDQGETAVFTITVTNDGAGNAYDVVLADQLPEGIVWTEDSPDATISNGVLIGNFGTLAAGESRTFHVSGVVPIEPAELDTDCSLRNEVFVGASNESTADQDDNRAAAIILINPNMTAELEAYLDGGNPEIVAPPSNVNTGPFEIDGNLVANTTGNLDWGNFSGVQIGVDLPTGQTDNSFGQGAKENSAVPSVVNGSIPNNKSDLTRFYIGSAVDANNDIQLYLAWERANTLGTANIDFEFNQSETISANGVTPVRTVGDILITFDFSSGGNVVNLGLRTWSGSAWSSAIDLDASGFASGAVNDGVSVVDPLTGATLADKTFGEAAINLSDSGVFPADQCIHFGSAFVKSRSSDSFTSELKDFIAPIAVNIDNCPDLHVTKTIGTTGSNVGTINAGDPVVFTLVVSNDGMGPATNVTLTDLLPEGFVWSDDSPYTTIVDGILTGNFGTLDSGESITIQLTGVATDDYCGVLLNEASVSADNEEDGDEEDNLGRALFLINPVLTPEDMDYLNTTTSAGMLQDTLAALFALAEEN